MQKLLIIAATVLSLAAAALGFLNHDKLIKERNASAAKLEEAASSKKSLQGELKTAKEKLTSIEEDNQKNTAEITDLRARAEKSTVALAEVQQQLSQKDSELAQQKTDLESKSARIAELESKGTPAVQAAAPSSEVVELKKQVEEKDLLATSLQTKLKDQEGQLTALKERENMRRKKQMKSGLEGRILAVNSAWNFVVLSLGDRNGVVGNAEMLIKRGSQLIGKVRVTSVEPSTSIADIVTNSVRSGLTVQPGDTVIYTGPETDPDTVKQ